MSTSGQHGALELHDCIESRSIGTYALLSVTRALDAIWKVATATLPSAMTFEFKQKIKHVFPEQETDLLAFVAELPATTLTLVMLDE